MGCRTARVDGNVCVDVTSCSNSGCRGLILFGNSFHGDQLIFRPLSRSQTYSHFASQWRRGRRPWDFSSAKPVRPIICQFSSPPPPQPIALVAMVVCRSCRKSRDFRRTNAYLSTYNTHSSKYIPPQTDHK